MKRKDFDAPEVAGVTVPERDFHPPHHVSSMFQLYAVFGTLVFLTVVTVFVSRGVNLGYISLFVALLVASVKAALVMAYFMHLRYDRPFNALLFVGGFLFLSLFLFFALVDSSQYQPDVTRYQSDVIGATPAGS